MATTLFSKDDIVKCIDASGFANGNLTLGYHYFVEEVTPSGDIQVKNDNGIERGYLPWRFSLVTATVTAGQRPAPVPAHTASGTLPTGGNYDPFIAENGPESTKDLRQYRYKPEVF